MREFGALHPLPAAAGKTNGVDDRHRPKGQQRRGGRRLPAGVRDELLPQAVTLEHFLVLVRIGASEVPQKSVPPTDQHLQAAAGGVIVLVGFQVLSEPLNATGEGADLNFGRSGVRVMASCLFDLGFVFGGNGHVLFLSKNAERIILGRPKVRCKPLRGPRRPNSSHPEHGPRCRCGGPPPLRPSAR